MPTLRDLRGELSIGDCVNVTVAGAVQRCSGVVAFISAEPSAVVMTSYAPQHATWIDVKAQDIVMPLDGPQAMPDADDRNMIEALRISMFCDECGWEGFTAEADLSEHDTEIWCPECGRFLGNI